MNDAQEYLRNLFDTIEQNQFFPDDGRDVIRNIRERLAAAPDLEGELRLLYRVRNMAPFATALMWVTQQAQSDAARSAPTEEEQDLVLSKFMVALPAGPGDASPEPTPAESMEPQPGETEQPAATAEPEPGFGPLADEGTTRPPAGGNDQEFVSLMERFAEVVQSGDEARSELSVQILNLSQQIAEGSGFDEDLRSFCTLFTEFLMYVAANQLMDDVRVMNIMSNISSPVSSWGAAPPGERQGLLNDGLEILKNFKSMFE